MPSELLDSNRIKCESSRYKEDIREIRALNFINVKLHTVVREVARDVVRWEAFYGAHVTLSS